MPYQSVRNRYISDGAGVVPQPRLLIMLFDRLVLDVKQGHDALVNKQLMEANDKLCHAQTILLELNSALDISVWPEGEQLQQLYIFLHDELVQANVKKDARMAMSCLKMLTQLQEAWQGAYDQIGTTPLESFAPTNNPTPA